MLFEEALPLRGSDAVLSTLSLVQLSPSGRPQDLLAPGTENLAVLDVAPLGLTCSLLTVTMSCPAPDPPEGPGTQGMWRGALRILQLPGSLDCPLLQVLAGTAVGEKMEGSLPWIVLWLLEGNNYSSLLLRLDPQGGNLSLLQAALLGAAGRRMQVKQVRPTLWDAGEEARARRAALKSLRSGLLGDTLTEGGLSQLGRALRELRVVKAWSRCSGSRMLNVVEAEAAGLPEPQQVTDSTASVGPGLQRGAGSFLLSCAQLRFPPVAGGTASVGPGLQQMHPLGASEEQFFLAQARRQRLREQHRIWVQEELKHLEQEEEVVAGGRVKGLAAGGEASKEQQRWHREQSVLRLQLEALQAERDTAEQDLVALYDLHVQAARARTCHVLQVFRAWRGLWEEQVTAAEYHYRSLLAGVLQDTIDLATQNRELQAQNQQLQQSRLRAVKPEEKSADQESFGGSVLPPQS
ncbi:uncharacterized protein LOC100513976 isoform X5 [Sus scrofa]|uniref:uncharacterized protein LOC100513976 isoform X5 n=1 Tax=Sus scrofa TaxID=9823 RepID=UPI000A2B08BC|nr:uncharacterized protein LOC100513976 isoform X5 [Sus scrofa]